MILLVFHFVHILMFVSSCSTSFLSFSYSVTFLVHKSFYFEALLCLYLSVFLLLFTCVVFSQYSHVILNIELSKGFLFFLSCWVYFKKNEKEKQNIFPKAGLSKLVSGGQWDQDSTLIDQCATNLISLLPLAKLLAFFTQREHQ